MRITPAKSKTRGGHLRNTLALHFARPQVHYAKKGIVGNPENPPSASQIPICLAGIDKNENLSRGRETGERIRL